ncbi:hypothetical protein NLI96_g495 [Meripilus lineatus]|uniref:Uncharacterized protein n=1 Tax=Meripilus lineatus TaxID=2056292 RepID=A0AAD5VC09_9APHY|nr:hypothetical protein NLI96_g495 [Physisporinus lineatus]
MSTHLPSLEELPPVKSPRRGAENAHPLHQSYDNPILQAEKPEIAPIGPSRLIKEKQVTEEETSHAHLYELAQEHTRLYFQKLTQEKRRVHRSERSESPERDSELPRKRVKQTQLESETMRTVKSPKRWPSNSSSNNKEAPDAIPTSFLSPVVPSGSGRDDPISPSSPNIAPNASMEPQRIFSDNHGLDDPQSLSDINVVIDNRKISLSQVFDAPLSFARGFATAQSDNPDDFCCCGDEYCPPCMEKFYTAVASATKTADKISSFYDDSPGVSHT